MGALFTLIASVCGLGSLICLILVLIRMFQSGQTGLGVVCIVLLLFCGIGALITFIVGWVNAARWQIQNVMLAWTGCIAVGLLAQILRVAVGSSPGIGV